MRVAVAAAVHHSAYKPNAATYVDAHTQTMTFSDAATYTATASPFTVTEDVAPAPAVAYLCFTNCSDRVCGTCNTRNRERTCGARTCD